MNQNFIVLIVLVMLLSGTVSSAMAYTLEVNTRTWSLYGTGTLCVWNSDAKKQCTHVSTTYKDKMVKNFNVPIKKSFIGDGEIFQVCINMMAYHSFTKTHWGDCSVTRMHLDNPLISLNMDSISDDKYIK